MTRELSCSDGGRRRYRYYRCAAMIAKGSQAGPMSRVQAGEIESLILDRIREIGRYPRILKKTIAAGKAALDERKPEIHEASRGLGDFDDIWGELFPGEQARVVQLRIEKIDSDVPGGGPSIAIT